MTFVLEPVADRWSILIFHATGIIHIRSSTCNSRVQECDLDRITKSKVGKRLEISARSSLKLLATGCDKVNVFTVHIRLICESP